jgi:hypothetical protein
LEGIGSIKTFKGTVADKHSNITHFCLLVLILKEGRITVYRLSGFSLGIYLNYEILKIQN